MSFLLAFCLMIACERPTDNFERSNHRDPNSNDYIPGSASQLDITSDNQGIVTITWSDTAQFEDGFIIEKSLTDTTSYQEIGRVDANVTVFRDSSKMVRKNTYYRVTSFLTGEDSIEKFQPAVGKLPTLGRLLSLETEYRTDSNSLVISWDENSAFKTGFYLEREQENDSTFTVVKKLKSEEHQFVDELSDISFNDRTYRLRMVLEGEDFEDTIDESITTFDARIFYPSDLNITISSEQSVEVSWADNSYFEDGFRIYRKSADTSDEFILVDELSANSTNFQDNFNLKTENFYTYKVAGYTATSESAEPVQRRYFSIPTPSFIHDEISNTNNSAITLNWEISDESFVTEFILEQKNATDESWDEIARVDKSTRSFTVTDVDTASAYTYRIRTVSSHYSANLELYYKNLFTMTRRSQAFDDPVRFLEFSLDGKYLAAATYDGTLLKLWNLETGYTVKYINVPLLINSLSISPDSEKIAVASMQYNKVIVYDIASESPIAEFSFDGVQDVEFGSNSNHLFATAQHGIARKWDVTNGEMEFEYNGEGTIFGHHEIAVSSSRNLVAISDRDFGIKILDSEDGTLLRMLGYDGYTAWYKLKFSPEGDRLAFEYEHYNYVMDLDNWSIMDESGNRRFLYSDLKPGSDLMVGANREEVFIKNFSTNEMINKFTVQEYVRDIEYSPDGEMIAIGFYSGYKEYWEEDNTKAWKEIY